MIPLAENSPPPINPLLFLLRLLSGLLRGWKKVEGSKFKVGLTRNEITKFTEEEELSFSKTDEKLAEGENRSAFFLLPESRH